LTAERLFTSERIYFRNQYYKVK